jgi:NAD(P)-dependent dehydrogenase (short-subunit alcohol dehydrogenase family)
MPQRPPLTVVTGASSGIGLQTALHLASLGHTVVGTVRTENSAKKLLSNAKFLGNAIHTVCMDVGSDESVAAAFSDIERLGEVTVLINNAGVAPTGVCEETSAEIYNESFNINVTGAVRCIQQVLPSMRSVRSGTIVNVSSVTGQFAALGQSAYVTSKWALEGLSEGLAQELAHFGIRVAIVQPGVTRTPIFTKNLDTPNLSGAYDAHYRRLLQFYMTALQSASPAEDVARTIYEAIHTTKPRLRYQCSWGAAELIEGRAAMTDEAWTEMNRDVTDEEYFERFRTNFGLDIAPQ